MLIVKDITVKQKPIMVNDHGRKVIYTPIQPEPPEPPVIYEPPEPYTIRGSLQPWDGELVKSLPEIARTKQKYVLFTEATLNIYDTAQPHQISVNSKWLDILASEIWSEGIIHNCYVLAKLVE